MKKFYALMLIVCCICTAFAAARAEVQPTFYVEAPASAGAGDTISVRVGITGDFVASILNLKFYYDEASFEYIEHTRGPVLDSVIMSGMSVCEHSEDKHMIATGILITGDEGFSTQGVIFEAKFKVLSTARSSAKLELEVAEFDYLPIGQSVSTPISNSIENAVVSISGAGAGVEVTAAPIHTPTVPQPTEPAATQGTDATPAATQSADGTPAADPNGASAENTEPVTDATEPADVPISAETTEPSADSKNNGGDETDSKENDGGLSKTAKALIIAGGCVLAAGLAWLTVFFFKRGMAAGEEAKKNRGDKAQ